MASRAGHLESIFGGVLYTDASVTLIATIEAAVAASTYLWGLNCHGADLTGMDLSGGPAPKLKGAVFYGATLTNANFTGADMRSAHLDLAECGGADFTNCNMNGVSMPGASDDSSTAIIAGATFEGADRSNTTGNFVPAPTAFSASPATGPAAGGTAITISGVGFVNGATVTVGGVSATSVVLVSGSVITCVTPAHAAGNVSVVVTNPNGQVGTLNGGFTYV